MARSAVRGRLDHREVARWGRALGLLDGAGGGAGPRRPGPRWAGFRASAVHAGLSPAGRRLARFAYDQGRAAAGAP